MKARLGALLFGTGVLSLVVAAGLAFYVAPSVTKLPYDLQHCDAEGKPEGCLKKSVAVAENATFLQLKAGQPPTIQTGTLEATTEVVPQPGLTHREMTGVLAGEAVVWDVYGTVKWAEQNEVISQYHAEFALDRVSAAATEWNKQFLRTDAPPAPDAVTFAGQTYKFPFHTEQKDYEYFDRDLRRALPITFDGTEEIEGVETYRFKQIVPESDVSPPADRLSALLEALAPGATSGKVLYTNTRTIWVEPTSGNFIKVREQQRKTLVPDGGGVPVALLDGDFIYNDETISNSAASASNTRDRLTLVGRTLPIGLTVFGLLALVGGLLLFNAGRRSATASTRRPTDDATLELDSSGTKAAATS